MLASLLLSASALAGLCLTYEAAVEAASVTSEDIAESSGLAPSRERPGVWFTHNDSGSTNELYAFDLDGEYLGVHPVLDTAFYDWEDISGGPCPGAPDIPCLFIADTGDNPKTRPYVTIYAVREPPEGDVAELVATWHVTWPMGAQDCETLFVHPRTGRVYLVSKTYSGDSEVVRLPQEPTPDPGSPGVMEWVATLPFSSWGASNVATTGGDWDPSGERLAIRTYSHVFEWWTDPCDADAHWEEEPEYALVSVDRQGEAVAYSPEGDLITSSEGEPMVLQRYACTVFGPDPDPCPGDDTGEPVDTGEPPVDTGEPITDTGTDTSAPDDTARETGGTPDTEPEVDADTGSTTRISGGYWGGCGSRPEPGLASLVLLALPVLGGRRRRPGRGVEPARIDPAHGTHRASRA